MILIDGLWSLTFGNG